MRRIALFILILVMLPSSSSQAQTADLDLKVTEMLLYMIGCERPDDDPLNCSPGCRKPYETGFVRDPSGNLTYNPAVVDRGNGVFDVVSQSGCGGDFLDRYRLNLQADTVERIEFIEPGSPSVCNPSLPEVLGGPGILPLDRMGCLGAKAGDPLISFMSFGNSDIFLGRLTTAYQNGSSWVMQQGPFLLHPLCNSNADSCARRGVASVAALDDDDYYYLYFQLLTNPGSTLGIFLMRIQKDCDPPFVVLGQGGAQLYDKSAGAWVELDFDPVLGYTLEMCANVADLNRFRLVPGAGSVGVASSPTDGLLLTYHRGDQTVHYRRAAEPTFAAGTAPEHTIDTSLLKDYYLYESCPGGVAPSDPDDPCIWDWDRNNHHVELQATADPSEYLMFFSRLNRQRDYKFRFATVRMARVRKGPHGALLLPPSGTRASDGTFADRVEVAWNGVAGATRYEVWRNQEQKPNSAVRIASSVQGTFYNDTSAELNVDYHYWVRAWAGKTGSGLGPSDSGRRSMLSCAGLVQEAEDAIRVGRFQLGNNTGASGGQFVHVPENGGNNSTPKESDKMSFCFHLPVDGTYRLKGRHFSAHGGSDSFFVRVDGQPSGAYNWVPRPYQQYADDYVNDYGVEDPVEISLDAGDHYVDVYLREDGTQLDVLELELQGPDCGGLFQQAEDGFLVGGFEVVNDAAASGGAFVHTPEGSGNKSQPNSSDKVSFCFNVPMDGTYRLKGRHFSAHGGSDSFFVKVDGQPSGAYNWVPRPYQQYADDYVNDYGVEDPVEVFLTQGSHQVEVFLREDGTRLDTLELEIQGLECGGLIQEAEDSDLSGKFQIANDSAASGGAYVHAPEGSGNNSAPLDSDKMSFCFEVPADGTYRLKGRHLSAHGGSDSFFVKVNGQPSGAYNWVPSPYQQYADDYVNDYGVEDPVEVFLTQGSHQVEVFLREDGTRLDTLALGRQ